MNVVKLSDFRKSSGRALVPAQKPALPAVKDHTWLGAYTVRLLLGDTDPNEFVFVANDSGVTLEVTCYGLENAKGLLGILKENARARQLFFNLVNFTGIHRSVLVSEAPH